MQEQQIESLPAITYLRAGMFITRVRMALRMSKTNGLINQWFARCINAIS